MNSPQHTPADPERSSAAVLLSFLRVFRKNILLIAVIVIATGGAATFYTLGQNKVYRATAKLQIDPSPPSPLGRDVQTVVAMGSDSYWSNKEYYETQYRLLQSRRIAEKALATLGLERSAAFAQNLPKGAEPLPGPDPERAEVAGALLDRLAVDPVKDSRIVKVTFEDSDPDRAVRVLAAVIDAFLDANIDDVVRSTGSASDWLRDQVGKLKTELDGNELALHRYKKDKRILSVSLEDQSNMLADEMQRLNQALTDVRVRRENLRSRAKELESVNPSNPVDMPASELLASPLLSEMRGSYLRAKSDESSLLEAGKGMNHPDVLAAHARVEATREALMHEVANVKGALERDLVSVASEATGLAGLLESAKQRAFDLGILEIDYRKLERSKVNTEKLYSLVLERSKESELTGLMRFNNIHVVEEPLANRRPVTPRVPLNIGLGLAFGVALGLLVALGREHLDHSLRNSEDVETEIGLPFLGLLPEVPGMRRRNKRRRWSRRGEKSGSLRPELQVHERPGGLLAEATRIVRTNLTLMSPDRPNKVFLVTSSQPSEGKTTVACAIAIAMAQAGNRVLIMDCDLRQSRLNGIYSVDNSIGLTGVILDPSEFENAVSPSVVPNLSVLPVGPRPPNPAEVLQSETFKRVLAKAKESFDILVIDSPPVSIVSDSTILAAQVDATVFVVRAGQTSRDSARRAARSLRDVSARVAGVVLNSADIKHDGYYGYYNAYVEPHNAPAPAAS